MASHGVHPFDDGLDALFENSPDLSSHTSAAAEAGFLLGLVALAATPFSLTYAVAFSAAVVGLVLSIVGVATTSSQRITGRALAPAGLACALVALGLIGLRFLGLDTAFGDGLVPTIRDWLDALNGLFPKP